MEIKLIVVASTFEMILPPDLIWSNEFDWVAIAGGVDRTLGGTQIVWTNPIQKGRPIDLVANESRGWLSRGTVELLHNALEAMTPMELVLTYSDTTMVGNPFTFNVAFRYHDPPAVEVQPLIPSRVEFSDSDYYIGTIKLMEV